MSQTEVEQVDNKVDNLWVRERIEKLEKVVKDLERRLGKVENLEI